MRIEVKKGPMILGQHPTFELGAAPPGGPVDAAIRVTTRIDGVEAFVFMSPEEARDFACGMIATALAVAQQGQTKAAADARRSADLLNGGRKS